MPTAITVTHNKGGQGKTITLKASVSLALINILKAQKNTPEQS